MISVYCGALGAGKTVHAVEALLRYAGSGQRCFTNIRLTAKFPRHLARRVALLDDDEGRYPVYHETGKRDYTAFWHYLSTVPGVILIDEADGYFDALDHGKFGEDMRLYLKMSRKLGHEIIFIVQQLPNLYVRMRRMAQRFVVCEYTKRTNPILRSGWLPESFARFVRSEFGGYPFTHGTHVGDGHLTFREAKEIFGMFDTKQLIGSLAWRRSVAGTFRSREDAGERRILTAAE